MNKTFTRSVQPICQHGWDDSLEIPPIAESYWQTKAAKKGNFVSFMDVDPKRLPMPQYILTYTQRYLVRTSRLSIFNMKEGEKEHIEFAEERDVL